MAAPPDPPRRKRKRASTLVKAAAGVALATSGAALALGPGAPWIVDHAADGLKIWRLGRLEVDGVSGTSIADLRARRVALADARGVWAEAENVSVGWNPMSLLGREIDLTDARAERIVIARQPVLAPSERKGGLKVDVALDDIRVQRLELAKAVFGEAASFTASLKFATHARNVATLDVRLERLDSDADHAFLHYESGPRFALNVDIASARGAVIARALGVPDQGIVASATGDGDETSGELFADIVLDGGQVAVAQVSWTPQRWSVDSRGDLSWLPLLSGIRKRLGDSAHIAASGARVGAFAAHGETPFLKVDVAGVLGEGFALDGAARVTAETARISDIAPEAPFEFGAARFEGAYREEFGRRLLEGAFEARELNILGRVAQLTGPLKAELNAERFALEADLRAPETSPALFADARLRTQFHVDRGDLRFALDRADLTGSAVTMDARGWARPNTGEFSGQWRVRKLEALIGNMRGAAGGQWRAFTQARVWTITASGRGANYASSPDMLQQMLGPAPELDGVFRIERGGVTVSQARINGSKLRIGGRGRVEHGVAELALETSARGPLRIGGVDIDGAADGTGRLNGRITRPSIALRSELAHLDVAAIRLDKPRIDFSIAPDGGAYRGQVEMDASYAGQAFNAVSDVSVADGGFELASLRARLGGLEGQGAARFGARGMDAQLTLSGAIDGLAPGVAGALSGTITATPENLSIEAELSHARIGELRVSESSLGANGPYDALVARFDMRGAMRRAPLNFAGQVQLNTARDSVEIRIEGRGALAGAEIVTRAPLIARWSGRSFSGSLDASVADGGVHAVWSETGRAMSGALVIDDAPIAPLAAIWGERAVGRVEGSARIVGEAGLSGDADFTLTDARFAGRSRGALTSHVVAKLSPTLLTAQIDARSSDGLTARFEASAPVETSAAPLRIARVRERPGHASWSLSGPVEGLWAALRLPDQALQGDVSGEGELSFGAGALTGDGRIELSAGRFEDKISGVKLQDIDAQIAIGAAGVTVERFTATDSRGGRITATGGSATASEGHVAISAQDVRLIDRPDARMRASGELRLDWQGLQSTLSGQLNVAEGDISVAQNAEAGIPQMDVIEINRPGDEEEFEPPAPRAGGATRLDVRINAPGRVFTRGRGVDAEWALDLQLSGTTAQPRLFGEARAVRGTLNLSGQAFDIQTGRIYFNGAPDDARIDLTASRDTADLTARIVLSGTAANPDVAFQSEPALPEDEILPQVLFGRSMADLSALEAAQLAASLAALSGQASFDIADAARAAAGLDRLAVREDSENGGLLVAGGVYLTRDVYVEVARTGLGQAATRVEWTVRPQLVLITSFLPNGDRRASVRWRKESD
jgi:translocation and assembly module TamB